VKPLVGVVVSEPDNVFGLKALLASGHGELDLLAFVQLAIPISADSTEMNEDVLSLLALDEAITLGIVEPLHCAGFTLGHVKHPPYMKR
jgi:hypothetical protein